MKFRFWKKDNSKEFKYDDDDEVKDTIRKYLSNDIEALSPIIKTNIENINIINKIKRIDSPSLEQQEELKKAQDFLKIRNIEPKSYLEDLAKSRIFIKSLKSTEELISVKKSVLEKNSNDFIKKDVLEEMFIESAFASYQFQKENNLPLSEFDKYFSHKKGSPFYKFKHIQIGSFKCTGDGFSQNGIIYLNPDIDGMFFNKYCLSTMETLTHELQHITNGIYVGNFISLEKEAFNEMCTEAISAKIVSQNLDNTGFEINVEFLENKKTMNIKSSCKSYVEASVLFDSFNLICDGKLPNIYYSLSKPFAGNSISEKSRKFLPFMLKTVDKAYLGLSKDTENKNLKNFNYNDHKYYQENFNAMITSFTDLAESYIRNGIGINKNTDFTSPEGESKLKKLSKFFNSFESITFVIGKTKDGKELYEREIIKDNILNSIFEDKSKAKEVKNLLDGKANTASATATTTSTSISTKAVSSSVTVTTVNNELSFVPSFSEVKLKENFKEFDINCSLLQLKQIFENYAKDNGFEKDENGKYYKEDASVDDVKKLINHFFETRDHFKGCIEFVTIKDKDNTYQINDFSSANNLDINIKQKSKELVVSEDLEL